MKIDIITIFPEIAEGPLSESIMKRARESGLVEIRCHDLRDYTTDRHRQVDDEPYGGGPGMVMKPEPFFAAVEALKTDKTRVLMMTPQGKPFQQEIAGSFAEEEHLIILCGHYEGVDHRVIEALVDDEISIGDYVLTNGTIAAVIIVDAVVRLLPGVLGDDTSSVEESFSGDEGLLEAPQYTRPADFNGMKVPGVLLSGHHRKIAEWRKAQSVDRTREIRPDLLD
ncbi:MAG: tRNA (guanosine(37)-N1)-methyltransferase TrmD [Verrucomicrobiales bacterium]|nr:tRNA (guanosine(37)-N1)-methyltransferase TrmD [Verrucomicrobiales bacterium]